MDDSVQKRVNTAKEVLPEPHFCQPCTLAQQLSVPKCLEYGKADAEMASRVVCVCVCVHPIAFIVEGGADLVSTKSRLASRFITPNSKHSLA